LTIAVGQDVGPLNIYSSDNAFDWMVELVYDKLQAPYHDGAGERP
jgi:hypothetical protein